jgi:hypothetical protein
VFQFFKGVKRIFQRRVIVTCRHFARQGKQQPFVNFGGLAGIFVKREPSGFLPPRPQSDGGGFAVSGGGMDKQDAPFGKTVNFRDGFHPLNYIFVQKRDRKPLILRFHFVSPNYSKMSDFGIATYKSTPCNRGFNDKRNECRGRACSDMTEQAQSSKGLLPIILL